MLLRKYIVQLNTIRFGLRPFCNSRDKKLAPQLPVLEAVKERIIESGGFSHQFRHHTAMSIVFHGYGTNASLLHAIIELGFPAHLLYVLTKPHTTDNAMRYYFKTMGVHYVDFAVHTYRFPGFKKTFAPGTYPAGYYDEAMKQYFQKAVDIQRTDLLRLKRYPEVKQLTIIDEGSKYHSAFEKVKELYVQNGFRLIGLGHSTSDLLAEHNEVLTYPKISMAGAALKTIVEAKEIADSNLETIDQGILLLPRAVKQTLAFGVLGCGNIGMNAIQSLLARSYKVVYFDTSPLQVQHLISQNKKQVHLLTQAKSKQELFNLSDIVFSCVGQDISADLDYKVVEHRSNSPLQEKLVFNFASGEKEFGAWLRESQAKNNPRIVNPQEKIFPDCHLNIAGNRKLIIRFSGMPANMMLKGVHGLAVEKAQLIRAMKLVGIHQLDQLLNQGLASQSLYFSYYIKLDSWWQRFILKKYVSYMIERFPYKKAYYDKLLKKLSIEEIERSSQGITPPKIKVLSTNTYIDSIVANPLYVTRESIVSEIDDIFLQPTLHQKQCVLYGIPGSGKTQIARHYYIYHAQHYPLALYIYAKTREDVVSQYKEKLYRYKKQKYFGTELEIINDFIDWVEKFPSSLLVYDSVEDHNELNKLLPNIGGQRILITSYKADSINKVEVPSVMSKNEAYELLSRIIRYQDYQGDDCGKIHLLVKELYYFPLAIAQAGAMINADESISITQFIEVHRKNNLALINSKKDIRLFSAEHQSIYITWKIAEERMKNKFVAYNYILHAISLLPTDIFTYNELIKTAERVINKDKSLRYYSDKFEGYATLWTFAIYPNIPLGFMKSLCVIGYIEFIAFLVSNFYFKIDFNIDNFYYLFFPGLAFITLHKLAVIYENYFIKRLNHNIHPTIKQMIKVGIISKLGRNKYFMHQLVRKMLFSKYVKLDLESLIGDILIANAGLNELLNREPQNDKSLIAIYKNFERLQSVEELIKAALADRNKLSKNYLYYHNHFTCSSYGAHGDLHPYTFNGLSFYHDIFFPYIQFSFQTLRAQLYLRDNEQCIISCKKILALLKEFYYVTNASDQVFLFDHFEQLVNLIEEVHHSLLIKKEDNIKKAIYTRLSLENIPQLNIECPIERIDRLKSALEKYITNVEDTKSFSFFSTGINEKKECANWLLNNLPLPYGMQMSAIVATNLYTRKIEIKHHDDLTKYQKIVLADKNLMKIIEEHYPIFLIEGRRTLLSKVEEWWKQQKDLDQESPFENSSIKIKL